ncbi:serine protease [Myxococcus sp. CA051A]|uniref:S1C family serine protease n=1 Tax=unclassified Myxococcus TaxID=2648731 RepID=UPI00157AE0BD|nr:MULTISPECIES: S1C family serine protease [unclassified Myxococcus]NTX12216.1 serine protease [Myxococcus sp. CA056]NTX33231.1 serine protease [Myxococcus sp. CA033]NTX52385.1 serine protease [Myxococcus sp. CA039A]NTX59704.1 serine protease [Myxococcus sp. CA051A]
MSESVEQRCLRCGAPDAGSVARCVCGASLRVDVVLRDAVADERTRFALARAISLLGPPAPSFSEARTLLATAGAPLARGVFRAFAEKLLEVLRAQGARADLRPFVESVVPVQESSRGLLRALVGACVLVGLVGGIWMARSPRFERTRSNVLALATGEDTPGEAAPVPSALSTAEISRRAGPSTLTLRCGSKTGSGFFVDSELVLTNQHVVCPPGKMMTAVLADGRELLGETVASDVDLDLATVRVVGAKAVPLPLGDVTRLEPGDPLVFIGSPKGLDFTVHEGKVGFVGRQYLGTGYVQFNASVNPGNSGGPLLNGRGEVVGVVSMKIENADGLGLALPIAYASKLVSVPTTPESTERWSQLLKRVARDEEREVRRFQVDTEQQVVLSVQRVDGLGLIVLVVERFDSPPTAVKRRMELEAEGKTCTLDLEFEDWRPLSQSLAAQEDSRRLRWFLSRGLTLGIHIGGARLPVETCSLPEVGTAWLKSGQGSGENEERIEVSLKDVREARETWTRNPAGIQRWERERFKQRLAGNRTREEEERWRTSFGKARARVARFEEERARLRKDESSGKPVAKRQLEVEAELKLASQQLAELERYAVEKNVPPEWRR